MGYALAAVGLAMLVAAVLIRAMVRPAAGVAAPAASYDLKVWRGQLSEIERDVTRGVLAPGDADRARIEVSRRIIEADRQMQGAGAAGGTGGRGALFGGIVAVALILAAAFGLYSWLGAPGYPDLPLQKRLARAEEVYKTRISQAEAEARAPKPAPRPAGDPQETELMDKLRAAVKDRPGDLQGHELLARNEAALGNFAASAKAQEVVLALKADKATAMDYLALADAQIMAAGGYVSPEAERALTEVLKRDGQNAAAQFYMGLMFAQNLRPDLTFRLWRPLVESGPADAPWMALVRDQIEGIAAAAGIAYQLPGQPGPDAAAMAAAADMSPEERQQMILGMVNRLNERLASQGGSPEDWARLIDALGQLGDKPRGQAVVAEARTVFAGKAEALQVIEAAASRAGIAE